jgi:uncharacterized repeat protein (TIGR03803 family)
MQHRKSSLALTIVKGAAVMLVLLSALGAFAGTESVLWNFTANSGNDAEDPLYNGPVFDTKGNLFGATLWGGSFNEGAVFELSPNGQGGWNETVLYSFNPESTSVMDGGRPCGSVVLDSKGNLYGTTLYGGTNGTGTIWELSPPAAGGTVWTEAILYNFGAAGSGDGGEPFAGVTLASSAATTFYGTTLCGGTGPTGGSGAPPYGCPNGAGTVYELTYVKPTKKVKGGWKETVLYSFAGSSSTDGILPQGGLTLKGKYLYGVTSSGGTGAYCRTQYGIGCGTVFELQPGADGWSETVLYNFGATATDGTTPGQVTPVMVGDDIYGTTEYGGSGNPAAGTAWELVYSAGTQSYSEEVLYSFGSQPNDGFIPGWQLVQGKKANTWYGTTFDGGEYQGSGTIFELTYTPPTKKSPGGWKETNVYEFTGYDDGYEPGKNELIVDKSGNLYGMSWFGGLYSKGAVFEFQP